MIRNELTSRELRAGAHLGFGRLALVALQLRGVQPGCLGGVGLEKESARFVRAHFVDGEV